MPKYAVISQIRGLEDPKKLKGVLVEQVLEPGDTVEMDADKAKILVDCGALKPDGLTDAEVKAQAAATKAAADAETKRRAALTPEQRKAEDDAAAAQGGQ